MRARATETAANPRAAAAHRRMALLYATRLRDAEAARACDETAPAQAVEMGVTLTLTAMPMASPGAPT